MPQSLDRARPRSERDSARGERRPWLARWSQPRSRGQGLAEFALVLPILILSLLIVLDFGRLFFSYVTLTNATRIAANYGSTDPKAFTGTPVNTTTYNATLARETAGLNCPIRPDAGGHNPPIPTYPGGSALGSYSVVTMTCDFSLMTPLMNIFFGGALPISVTSQFPVRTGAITNIGGTTTVPPPGSPIASFTFTSVSGGSVNGSGDVVGTTPVTVNVQDASTNAQTWQWEWDDGQPDEFIPNPAAHQFTTVKTYNVKLTVTNTVGSSSLTRTVTVNSVSAPPPVAGFYGDPVAVAPNYGAGGGPSGTPITGSRSLTVNFTNQSTDGTSFSWDFGDGTTPSTSPSPQHNYTALGIYNVTLTVTAPAGGSPLTRANYVTVGCVVPNFAGTSTSQADAIWSGADFSGATRFRVSGNTGPGNPNPPGGSHTIVSQSLPGGTFVTPTKNGSNPYRCDVDILLDYT